MTEKKAGYSAADFLGYERHLLMGGETISGDKDESDTVILHITVWSRIICKWRTRSVQRRMAAQAVGGTDAAGYQELFAALTGSWTLS